MSSLLNSDFFHHQAPPCSAARWVIGFSGGLDSTVLLHLCAAYRNRYQPDLPLAAVHVHHGLADQADQWLAHCEKLCQQLEVPFFHRRVTVQQQSRRGLEQQARQARYDSFRETCGSDDLLLLAHHQDDQAETLLYRLMRGTGVLGLRAMEAFSESAGLQIWRPLLGVSRADLEAFARQQGLTWVEDPSNSDLQFDRNFIRRELMPLLSRRWPAAGRTLSRTARLAAESARLNDVLAQMDMAPALGKALPDSLSGSLPNRLEIPPLQALETLRLKNVLRYWLRQQGSSLPSEQVLLQVVALIRDYHPQQNGLVEWGEAGGAGRRELRTFQHQLWLLPARHPPDPDWCGELRPGEPLSLPGGLGTVSLSPATRSASESAAEPRAVAAQLPASLLAGPLTVRFRQGGERFQPRGRPAKPLKKWLQEWQVPPWERDRLPLLFSGDRLVWVPGHGVAADAVTDQETPPEGEQWQVAWLIPPQPSTQ